MNTESLKTEIPVSADMIKAGVDVIWEGHGLIGPYAAEEVAKEVYCAMEAACEPKICLTRKELADLVRGVLTEQRESSSPEETDVLSEFQVDLVVSNILESARQFETPKQDSERPQD